MRFLLNMNVSRVVGRALAELGQEWVHVRDLGLAEATDQAIIAVARQQQQVIVTHDLDYGDLLVLSGSSHPSVIIFRLRLSSPTAMCNRLCQAWPKICGPLEQGSVVVIEDAAARIRFLGPSRADL